jgi:hypothetical protein
MKELTKGTLVMTEHGLAWYDGKSTMSTDRYYVEWLDQTTDALDGTPTIATRAQVEVKIKEMGLELYPSERGQFYAKRNSQYIVRSDYSDYFPESKGLIKDFDTAPAQQAEAILVARLLNATKD